jgi:hypothetical protein
MTTAIRRRARSTRSRVVRLIAAGALAITGAAIFHGGVATAVHDLDFQLDRNVVSTPDGTVGGAVQEIDWADLFDANGDELPLPTGFDASVFDDDFQLNANGTFNTADTSTWATGSKDTLNISGGGQQNGTWQCKRDNNLLDKNDIMNAYAVSYAPTGGDEILYFALERNGNEGAANVGFWFLQDGTVDCNAPGGGNFQFSGNHVDGDLLVVSEFTQGGTVSTIQVFRWSGGASGCVDNPNAAGSCDGLPITSGADCVGAPADDDACATANTGPITTPWTTVDKTTVGHTLDAREFFEGGVNLTDTGLGGKCFNTFMASTRASQELGSNLHDYSRGELGGCTSTTVTTPSTSSATIPAHGTLGVTDSANITVTGSNDWDGEVKFFLCRAIELTNGVCAAGGTQIGTAVPLTEATVMPVSSAPAGLTAVGRYCWRAEFTSTTDGVPDSSDSRTSECLNVTPLQPVLTTDATDGPVDFGQPISDTISLTGTADTPGTNGIGPGGTINATNRQPADGTISFTAFGPDNCTTVAHSGTITVSGDNAAYGGPGSVTQFTPTAPGVYTYVASYTGETPNTLGVATTACPDPTGTEVVTVRQIDTDIRTKQSWFPQDTAEISADAGNLDAGGTVRFELFTNATCADPSVYDQTVTLQGGAPTEEVGTTNTSYRITTGYGDAANSLVGQHSWRVTYRPDANDPAHTGSASTCDAEHFNITYTNDPGPGINIPNP